MGCNMISTKFAFSCVLVLSLVVASHGASCPAGMVEHNNGTLAICCHPVFNCGPDAEIKTCTTEAAKDECVPCKDGYINNRVTNSLGDNPSQQCFKKESNHAMCPTDDTVAHQEMSSPSCMIFCRCNNDLCFYGNDACDCSFQPIKCDVNNFMDPISGACQPCPKFTYKLQKGCGPCTWNETAWMLAQGAVSGPVPAKTTKVTASTENTGDKLVTTDNHGYVIEVPESTKPPPAAQKSDSDGVSAIAVAIIVVLLVAISVLVAIVLYLYRRIQKNDEKSCLVRFYRRNTTRKETSNGNIVIDEDPEARETSRLSTERPQHAVAPVVRIDGSPTSVNEDENSPSCVTHSEEAQPTSATRLMDNADCEANNIANENSA